MFWWTWLVVVAAVAISLVAFWLAELATRPRAQSLAVGSPTMAPDAPSDR